MTVASQRHKGFPAIEGVRWFNLAVLVFTPLVALYGVFFIRLDGRTLIFAIAYYFFTVFGVTAGYHRLWSHRSYNATFPLQIFLILGGASSVQGSCYWWARAHRSHHRWTDTDKDPYDSTRGLLWSHIGWILFKTQLRSGSVDASDLAKDPLIKWSHRYYFPLAGIFGYAVPMLVPVLWGDFWGGLCFSTAFRMIVAHHSVFAINSIAHYLGSTTYDDALSPRDHFLSGNPFDDGGRISQLPSSETHRTLWYQWDPTKWFIASCKYLGLANNLRVFPSNEIAKGALTMKLKSLKELQDSISWPPSVEELPIMTWDDFEEESKTRPLILVSGFIHDASTFIDKHPGGATYLTMSQGTDRTAAFNGGIYRHSNAAHNLLSMMRVGVLAGGGPPAGAAAVPPAQALFVGARS